MYILYMKWIGLLLLELTQRLFAKRLAGSVSVKVFQHARGTRGSRRGRRAGGRRCVLHAFITLHN